MLPALIESALIDRLHAIAQYDDVFGRLPDETQRGADQWHRDRIGRVRQGIKGGLEAGPKAEALAAERMLAWRIRQLVPLLIEGLEKARILVLRGGRKRFALASVALRNGCQEALCRITIKIGETGISHLDHPTDQQAQAVKYVYQRHAAGRAAARWRVGR